MKAHQAATIGLLLISSSHPRHIEGFVSSSMVLFCSDWKCDRHEWIKGTIMGEKQPATFTVWTRILGHGFTQTWDPSQTHTSFFVCLF